MALLLISYHTQLKNCLWLIVSVSAPRNGIAREAGNSRGGVRAQRSAGLFAGHSAATGAWVSSSGMMTLLTQAGS